MKRDFIKMHGIGNDYIYFDCLKQAPPEDLSGTAIRLSDRHFSIGGDGIVLILPSDKADFRMRMFNADGSEGKMCGNAIRCVGKYVYDYGYTNKKTVSIETLSGVKHLTLDVEAEKVSAVRVDMGEAILAPRDIPVDAEGEQFVNMPVSVGGREVRLTCVSMGNPHAVVFCDDVKGLNLAQVGPQFENHPLFPDRINTEFVHVIDKQTLEMRVWERGSGETMACGTGACATAVAAVLNGYCERDTDITVRLLGGDLHIVWGSDGHVLMTGPAAVSFEGTAEL